MAGGRTWWRAALVALGVAGAAGAQAAPLLAAGSVTTRDDHLDLAIEFSCAMTYRSHTPGQAGERVRVSLAIGPDCDVRAGEPFPVERLMPGDARDLVRDIALQPGLAGGAELLVEWSRAETFVLVPTSGMRGLRIRVQRRRGAQVVLGDSASVTADYAVNIASAQQPFDPPAIAAAEALLQTRVYVSTTEVEGTRWYRLRAGPFATRAEAGEVLRLALARYPTAWLGVADEATTLPADAAARIGATTVPRTPETRADPALDQQLEAARVAMNARRLDEATRSLTRILAVEDYARRREAAELLGLARERQGQLAQAKAAYEEYLRRYPDSPAAARLRERLRALRLADIPGHAGSRGGARAEGWSAWGHASQSYRRDDARLDAGGGPRETASQAMVLTDVDGLLRRRGERFDFAARSSLGYLRDLEEQGDSRLRVSTAYAELGARELSLTTRLGRQSRGMAGVNGVFDGLLGNWQARPRLGASMAVGAPVENTRHGPDFDRLFVGGSLEWASRDQGWETAAFALAQQYAGHTDRRSIGIEARYLRPGRTLVAMGDYDAFFGQLNGAMLLGTLVTATRWTFNVDASRQRSPQLSLRNALIGQPTLAFADLESRFTTSQLEQIALDRSAELTQLSATASHPLGEGGQWSLGLSSFDLSGMPASGDVEAVPAPGREDSLYGEVLLNGLLRAGDTHAFGLRAQRGGRGTVLSGGVGSRMPLGAAWRLTTRLRVERRTLTGEEARAWNFAPSMRVEYQRSAATFELEAGVELNRRRDAGGGDRDTRRYISAGYRWILDRRQ
jgi:tetratricopeptide (TPR) repeat protein